MSINTNESSVKSSIRQQTFKMDGRQQKSPVGQFENADLDEYDEETDEFAGYSGS